jgi:hypothetical protein
MSDVTIHFTSNNPMEHKLAAFQCLFHRAYNLPITKEARTKELETIFEIARSASRRPLVCLAIPA